MRKPVITFDCDGVFANFTKRMTEMVNSRFGTEYSEHWSSYGTDMQIDHVQAGFAAVNADPYFWGMLEAYPDVPFRKIGSMLNDGAITGYVVSRRGSDAGDAAAQTRHWLNGHGLTSLQGVIVGNQHRPMLLTLLECDAHIDDFGDQVVDLRNKGVNAYLLDRPWNQDTKIHWEYRVKSIDEFLERVVSEFLPEDAVKTYFTPPAITDLISGRDMDTQEAAELIRSTGFQFRGLAETSTRQTQ